MRTLWRLISVLMVSTAIAGPAAGSDVLRCGARLVSVEDRVADLLAVCGEPAFRDTGEGVDPFGRVWTADVEEWTYDFGPSRLLQVLRLRSGRIVDIRSDGYGFASAAPSSPCSADRLVEGPSKYRLLMTCGEPLTRRSQRIFRADRSALLHGSRAPALVTPILREEWVYDLGPNLLQRILTLENGRVIDVQNGGRGGVDRSSGGHPRAR